MFTYIESFLLEDAYFTLLNTFTIPWFLNANVVYLWSLNGQLLQEKDIFKNS